MAIQNKFSHGSTRMDTDKPLNSSPRKTSGIGVPIRPASAEECHLGFRDSAIETGYLSAYGQIARPALANIVVSSLEWTIRLRE